MKKLSIKKLSLLGLVLVAASAVTAAILPSNNKEAANQDFNGSVTGTSGDNLTNNGAGTCTPTANITDGCHDTTTGLGGSGTTAMGGSNSSATTLGDVA